jgi:hypothetical protein
MCMGTISQQLKMWCSSAGSSFGAAECAATEESLPSPGIGAALAQTIRTLVLACLQHSRMHVTARHLEAAAIPPHEDEAPLGLMDLPDDVLRLILSPQHCGAASTCHRMRALVLSKVHKRSTLRLWASWVDASLICQLCLPSSACPSQ